MAAGDMLTEQEVQALVDVSAFSSHTREGWVLVQWITRTETDCAGFNLYRRVSGHGAYSKINGSLIACKNESGATYTYEDRPLAVGLYDHQLEEVDGQGATSTIGTVTVQVFGDDPSDRGAGSGCQTANSRNGLASGIFLILLGLAFLWRRSKRFHTGR